jgi:hypothetical protein
MALRRVLTLGTGEVEADEVAATFDRYLHRDLLPVRSGWQIEDDVLAGVGKFLLPPGPPLDTSLAPRAIHSPGTQVQGERPVSWTCAVPRKDCFPWGTTRMPPSIGSIRHCLGANPCVALFEAGFR